MINDWIKKSKLGIVVIVFVVLFSFIESAKTVFIMTCPAPQDTSSEWIENNIEENSNIGLYHNPFAWHPVILQMNHWYKADKKLNFKKYNVVIGESDYMVTTCYDTIKPKGYNLIQRFGGLIPDRAPHDTKYISPAIYLWGGK